MKKRILFITSLFPSDKKPFQSTFVVSIVRSLLHWTDGIVIAPERWIPFTIGRQNGNNSASGNNGCPPELPESVQILRPKLILSPFVGRSLHWIFYFLSIYRTAAKVLKGPPVDCIFTLYAYPDAAASVLLGSLTGKKVIVRVMGCDINLLTRFFWRRNIIMWALRRAHHIVSVSGALKSRLVELGIPESKISVIHNGADPALFRPMDKLQCRRELGIPSDEKNVLFVGNLEPVKGVDTLLEAFKYVRREIESRESCCRLYILGDGPLLHELKMAARSLGLSGNVHFLGNRRNTEVPVWMNACDVFCLPSIREGMPNVILEALSCGRPIVATRVGGIPELLDHHPAALLVPPQSPRAVSAALVRFLEYGCSTTAEAGAEVDCFSWEKFGCDLYTMIEHVLQSDN